MRNPALPMKKTALSAVAALVLMCAIVPTPARADDEVIQYMDKDGNTCEIAKSEVIDITNLKNVPTLEDGKVYCLTANKEAEKRVEVKGNATLILCNRAHLECSSGMHCKKGNGITITGQVGKAGSIRAWDSSVPSDGYTVYGCAGLGGDNGEDGGEISICGCSVTASGSFFASGIGGGLRGDGSKVVIRNAHVEASGTETGAGIGGGGAGGLGDDAGDGGEVLIDNSTVIASAWEDDGGAGIGGGGDEWSDIGDQGNGGTVTIEGNSVVDATGGDGSAIGRGDDEGKVGTVILDKNLKVTDLSKNKGRVATAAEREGYCAYRTHVKIEPCGHEDATFDTSPSAHKGMCPHCYGIPEVVLFHEFGEDGNCKTCGYHAERPFFVAPEMGEGDQDYVVFWLDINGLDEATFEASYIDIEVCDEGTDTLKRRDKLSQWGERRGDLRSYATWVLDDVSDDALVIATVHYGKDLTVCQSTSLGELRAKATGKQ